MRRFRSVAFLQNEHRTEREVILLNFTEWRRKTMKKCIVFIASILLAAAVFANGSKETGSYKIYLITMDQMDQHWVHVDKGCRKAVQELGGNITYKWSAPDIKDDNKQIECINNAIADGANAILLAANGPTAVKAVVPDISVCFAFLALQPLYAKTNPSTSTHKNTLPHFILYLLK